MDYVLLTILKVFITTIAVFGLSMYFCSTFNSWESYKSKQTS